jgi:hypothetical protein
MLPSQNAVSDLERDFESTARRYIKDSPALIDFDKLAAATKQSCYWALRCCQFKRWIILSYRVYADDVLDTTNTVKD